MRPHRLLADLARELRAVLRAESAAHARLRARVTTALLATAVVDLIGSGLMYALERGAKGSEVTTFWRACFWVTAQLLTVSSQMPNPLTDGGRVVDLVLELWAITVVATLAGSVAAFFHAKDS